MGRKVILSCDWLDSLNANSRNCYNQSRSSLMNVFNQPEQESNHSDSLLLEHDVRIGIEVGHVDLFAVLEDFWVFAHAQPADVRKPKAAVGVMRVCIGVGIFVMLAVISNPNPKAILTSERMHVQQDDFQPALCFEGSVAPMSVRSHCYTLTCCIDQPQSCNKRKYN